MRNEGNVAGSAFFRLSKPPHIAMSADGQTTTPPRHKILICSRDYDTQVFLKTMLDLWRLQSQMSDCTEPLDRTIEAAQPSLILLDSILPFSAHLENIRQICRRKSSRDVPIIVISGFSQPNFKNMSLAAGANDFLVKPLDFDLLEKYLKKFLHLPD